MEKLKKIEETLAFAAFNVPRPEISIIKTTGRL